MKNILLAIFATLLFLTPTIAVGPTFYDGELYNHSIILSNPTYQPINDLYFVVENLHDYYDYTAVNQDLTCDFWYGELYCEISRPVESGTLAIVRTTFNELPKIAVCERNVDSYSLPKLVIIQAVEQYRSFIPMAVR